MKKLLALALLSLVFPGCASTATEPPAESQSCIMRDGEPVKTTMEFNGQTVGFCCNMCKSAFQDLSDEEKQARIDARK